jgi:hypothetical protein
MAGVELRCGTPFVLFQNFETELFFPVSLEKSCVAARFMPHFYPVFKPADSSDVRAAARSIRLSPVHPPAEPAIS